jgi:hypothetical protein
MTDGSASPLVVVVKHNKTLVEVPVSALDTIQTLQQKLQASFHVPVAKQRLLFAKGASKSPAAGTRLVDVEGMCSPAGCHPKSSPSIMLIGTPDQAVQLASAADVEPQLAGSCAEHLVAVHKETKDGLYMCSYPSGYAAQNAFHCRTCVNMGHAKDRHCICLACAEVCHAGHAVDACGFRDFMRCDCCTDVCWTGRQAITDPAAFLAHACRFVVDDRTGNAPHEPRQANSKNLYPRPGKWCYCKTDAAYPPSSDRLAADGEEAEAEAEAEEEEDYGCSCLLCNTCFWSPHLTHLHTAHLRATPCYGEVCTGPTVAYRCNTCSTLVCPPCRMRCHGSHDVDASAVFPSDGNHRNDAPPDCEFSCGCRGGCSIAESVPPELLVADGVISQTRTSAFSLPRDIAMELNDSDVFVGFICAYCMMEHPWLVENDLGRCYNGVLPERGPIASSNPVVGCGDMGPVSSCAAASSPISKSDDGSPISYPFHGMLVPRQIFSPEVCCPCGPCQTAFAAFHKRRVVPLTMYVPSGCMCSHCREDVGEASGAYLCTTCELNGSPSYLLCHTCYNSREEIGVAHDLSHEFIQDTFDNIWNVFGASLVRHVDPALQEWMTEHWHESRDVLFELLRGSFSTKRLRESEANEGSDDASGLE